MDHRFTDDLQNYVVGLKYLENDQILVQFLSATSQVKFQLILSKEELKQLSNFLYP